MAARVESPDIEVLICTHNRAALLQRTLDYLNVATRPPGTAIEITVAANACTDETREVLERYAGDLERKRLLPLSWFDVPTPGKSNALNEAIPRLRGALIAFVDDDHRVDAEYFTSVQRVAASQPDATLFCGRILPDWDGAEPSWVHHSGPYRIYPLPVPRFDLGPKPFRVEPGRATPGGGNLVLRGDVFSRVGGFAVDLGPVGHNLGGAEDIEWVRRAVSRGETLYYDPSVVQYHYVELERLKLGYLLHKAYERTMSTMRLNTSIGPGDRVPLYMLRKLLGYLVRAATSFEGDRRRYYLVRLAASIGEVAGFVKRRVEARAGIDRGRAARGGA